MLFLSASTGRGKIVESHGTVYNYTEKFWLPSARAVESPTCIFGEMTAHLTLEGKYWRGLKAMTVGFFKKGQ